MTGWGQRETKMDTIGECSSTANTSSLPIEIVSAIHFIADLTLGLGKTVHDYLQSVVARRTERRLACVS